MAKKLDKKEVVDLSEVLLSEVIQSEALINLLDRKGIVTKEELLKEIRRVKSSMAKAAGGKIP